MPRTQFDFFLTRAQLAEVLCDICRRQGASIVGLLRDPVDRGLRAINRDNLAAYLEQHHVPSLYVGLGPGLQPGDQGFEFLNGHPSFFISFCSEDAVKRELFPSMANADPDARSQELLKAFTDAVKERSNKGVVPKGGKRALPYWWERSLAGWKFPNYRLVLPNAKHLADTRKTKVAPAPRESSGSKAGVGKLGTKKRRARG